MARITIELPSMLTQVTGTPARVELRAERLDEALHTLVETHPALGVHLFDERGGGGSLRQHVLCFHNAANTRWLPSLDVPLQDGDTVTILQAVSGG